MKQLISGLLFGVVLGGTTLTLADSLIQADPNGRILCTDKTSEELLRKIAEHIGVK